MSHSIVKSSAICYHHGEACFNATSISDEFQRESETLAELVLEQVCEKLSINLQLTMVW